MVGSKLRDKDAVSAVAILCEMAAYEKSRGKTLFEKLLELYVKFGYYQEHLISITKKGRDGQQQNQAAAGHELHTYFALLTLNFAL